MRGDEGGEDPGGRVVQDGAEHGGGISNDPQSREGWNMCVLEFS